MRKILLQATRGCARDNTQTTLSPGGSLSPVPVDMLEGVTASWRDSGQDLAAILLRLEPGEQLRAVTPHITPPLLR